MTVLFAELPIAQWSTLVVGPLPPSSELSTRENIPGFSRDSLSMSLIKQAPRRYFGKDTLQSKSLRCAFIMKILLFCDYFY